MKSEIEPILNLQEIDIQIGQMNVLINRIPKEIESLEAEIEDFKKGLETKEQKYKHLAVTRNKLEGDIEEKNASIQKKEIQLNSVKTNHEYTAFLKEISGLKGQISEVEEKLLEIMEQLEVNEKASEEEQKEIDLKVDGGQAKIEERKNHLEGLNRDLEQLKSKREEVSKGCGGDSFKRYQLYLKKRPGPAFVPIEENGACGGCRWVLPPNVRNEVMKEKLIQCENCSRYLFWKPPDPEKIENENQEKAVS